MTLSIRKFANYFDRGAAADFGGAAGAAVENFRQQHGGIWVGGIVEITENGISFVPNRLNRALQSGISSESVPMDAVISVVRRFGWLTGIVVVTHNHGEFVFRCFGANSVARRINEFLKQQPSAAVRSTTSP